MGKGTFNYEEGLIYEGNFYNDVKRGKGLLV